MAEDPLAQVQAAVAAFGQGCRQKLGVPGVGEPEAQIRAPLEGLLQACGAALNKKAVFHDEVHDKERLVRPDYGVRVDGAMSGYVEVKRPSSKGLDPKTFTGHDKKQWERLKDLPNLLYTNGTEWRLYQNGQPVWFGEHDEPVVFAGTLDPKDASVLAAPLAFFKLMAKFLGWGPLTITSVGALVRSVAPLTRALRGEVLDQLAAEKRKVGAGADEQLQPFLGLARDWRALLFPSASDRTFADGYAQTVTFGLLLARTADIDLKGRGLHEVGNLLGKEHSLIGKALQLLTDDVASAFRVPLDLLVRVVGAVDWPTVRKGARETYLLPLRGVPRGLRQRPPQAVRVVLHPRRGRHRHGAARGGGAARAPRPPGRLPRPESADRRPGHGHRHVPAAHPRAGSRKHREGGRPGGGAGGAEPGREPRRRLRDPDGSVRCCRAAHS